MIMNSNLLFRNYQKGIIKFKRFFEQIIVKNKKTFINKSFVSKPNTHLNISLVGNRIFSIGVLLHTQNTTFKKHFQQNPIYIPKRYMRLATNSIASVTRSSYGTHIFISKRYSCFHGGTIKPKAPVTLKEADQSGYHQNVCITKCTKPACEKINCAQKQTPDSCSHTPQQNQQSIPTSGNSEQFETHVIGNLTSKIPTGKKGIIVSSHNNYSGKTKPQALVLEPGNPVIDNTHFNVNGQSTQFVQNVQNHNTLSNIPDVKALFSTTP